MRLIRSHNRSKEFAALRINVHSGDDSRAYARENKNKKYPYGD